MDGWVETYRGTVYRWEVDQVDHFTVAYYFQRFEDAMLGLLAAIGLHPGRLAEQGRTWVPVDCAVRYAKELRVGDILHVRSGVIGVEDTALRLGHQVFNSGTGDLSTAVEQRVQLRTREARDAVALAGAARAAAEARRVAWEPLPAPDDTEPATDAAFVDSARDTIKPWETAIGGAAAFPAYIHRFSAANAHLLAAFGMTPGYLRDDRRGFSTFAFRLRFGAPLRAGDLVRVRSGLLHVGSSSLHLLHRMTNVESGEVVATLAQSGVHLDVDARRPAPLPDQLRERAVAMLVPGAAAAARER